ncbi:two-component sensor histidine kinase [Virgibacillus profundi]|uniref:histidine kinase n=1 Tax=Virgibacillus profundi TaxID=2024555 RepID=A0A2A2I9K2_9BACI|nr:sensor histidine kinase [Virgibacillus profundi]PAV28681.1 two-component sensor histidine kinase [Virgibacillus profundi]PXY52849.1 sensor histidine kinase [Virgibacillus profundi]
MNLVILICIIFFLLTCNVYQFQTNRIKNKHITYIKNQIEHIIKKKSSGPILVVTEDKKMINLLFWLNKLIDKNRDNSIRFMRMELSMKRMLANVSHDLKTPLTVIAGYIEMLQGQTNISDKEQSRILHQVNEKTEEIITLMNTFFDLAKLEAGDMDIPLSKVNISEICKKNILLFYELIHLKGFEIIIDLPKKPVFALGNEEALNRVLSNLISNALRYGADGKLIGLRLCYDKSYVFFEIYDKGIGINEIEQEKIFERMFTLEESRNKAFQGSGLGLTISKRLMEEMQGSISVYSKPYERTSFSCSMKRLNG